MTKTIDALVEALEAENAALRADNASFIVAWKAHLEVAGVSAEIAERMVNETANKLIAARAALAQARAEQAEPVGWLLTNGEFTSSESVKAAHDQRGNESTPLYTTQPAAPVAKLEPLSKREIVAARDRAEYEWNAQADYWNQWFQLDADEKQVLIARAIEATHNAKLLTSQTNQK